MSNKSYHFIVNPKSGSSADIGEICHLRDELLNRGCFVRLNLTNSLSHAAELADQARRSDCCDVLVVAGGDGTISAMAGAMAGSEIPTLIMPSGTENLMARELGLDGQLKTALNALDNGHIIPLDLLMANGRYFASILGCGFDAQIIRRINQFRTGHITPTQYIWPICRTFWEYRFEPIRVVADGEVLCDEPALVFVSNITHYSIGLKLLPDADCSDGLLDLCIYVCRTKRQLLSHAFMTAVNRSHVSRNAIRRKCHHIDISSSSPDMPVQIDGDPGPPLPLAIDIVPAATKMIVPPTPNGTNRHQSIRFYHLRRWCLR